MPRQPLYALPDIPQHIIQRQRNGDEKWGRM